MSNDNEVRIHTVLALVWAGLLIPTLTLWSSSILWVAFMSLYANFVGHWSARESAKAKRSAEES